jgi:cytochrome b561
VGCKFSLFSWKSDQHALKMVLGIMILVIAILMIIIFPDESDESSGKFSGTQLSPTAAATAHFSLLLFAQPLAGWLVG